MYIYCTVPSMADRWLFSRPWSGFGGSGGGVFICLMSDSSTAAAEVRWQERKKQNTRDPIPWQLTFLSLDDVWEYILLCVIWTRHVNLLMHTLFWRSRLCIPLSLAFVDICLPISGLRNGGWTWTTIFLQGLAVYLVSHDKQPVSNEASWKADRLNWRNGSYFGEIGLQTRYSRLLRQPRVKGFTPPWNFPVTCGIIKGRVHLYYFVILDIHIVTLYWYTALFYDISNALDSSLN